MTSGSLVFEMSTRPPDSGDPFALWTSRPDSRSAAVPGDKAAGHEYVTWQADLPASLPAARSLLQQRRRVLGSASAALPLASLRLETFLQTSPQHAGQTPAAYALDEPGLPDAEAELSAWLFAVQTGETGAASFGGIDLWSPVEKAAQDARRLLELLRAFGSSDLVITRQAGVFIGGTRVSWLGGLDNYLPATVPALFGNFPGAAGPGTGSPGAFQLHQLNLQTSLDSRRLLTEVGLQVASAAVRMAGLLAASANPLLAAGAALRFFQQVLAAARTRRG